MIKNEIETSSTKNYLIPFILITSLFFFWGLIHNLDPVLIPHLRKAFLLNDFQSSLIDSAVYIAYFVMALPAGYIMNKYGYKSGILIGLLLFGIGCLLFVPAANTLKYIFFLGALFVIASGLTFLETAANPYATILGSPETATFRLNLAQSFNGFAAFIAPAYIGKLILSGDLKTEAEISALDAGSLKAYLAQEAASVKQPYMVLGIIILAVAVIFLFTKLPEIKDKEEKSSKSIFEVLKNRRLMFGVLAQFFYVGAQVCVGSFFIKMSMENAAMSEHLALNWLGYYGLAFMLGRFFGTFLMKYFKPEKLLLLYGVINAVLCVYAVVGTGVSIVYTLIAISFFMSIMFPTIFSLGIIGLDKDTKLGSSLIVMAIVGGAFLPPILGYISDSTHSINNGYIVPVVCFVVVAIFGYWCTMQARIQNQNAI